MSGNSHKCRPDMHVRTCIISCNNNGQGVIIVQILSQKTKEKSYVFVFYSRLRWNLSVLYLFRHPSILVVAIVVVAVAPTNSPVHT